MDCVVFVNKKKKKEKKEKKRKRDLDYLTNKF